MNPEPTSPLLQPTALSSSTHTSPITRMLSQPRLRPGAPHGSNASIKLPSLPPFHPANFPSAQHSSAGNTPSSGVTSSQPPVSPRQQQRQYNDIQKQLQAYQRDIIATAMRRSPVASSCGVSAKPDSPKLEPLGSPGPVTPLILEEQGGYIASAARSAGGESATQDELVDRLIREEARRRGERPTSVGKP